jgi:DnaK suppressor protein
MQMYENKLASQFEQLLALREQELCEVLRTREAQREASEAGVCDFKELALEDTQAIVDENQAELAAHELEQVLAARRRLQDHQYGRCLDCGEPVDLRRLSAMPATRYCILCQQAHEYEDAIVMRH